MFEDLVIPLLRPFTHIPVRNCCFQSGRDVIHGWDWQQEAELLAESISWSAVCFQRYVRDGEVQSCHMGWKLSVSPQGWIMLGPGFITTSFFFIPSINWGFYRWGDYTMFLLIHGHSRFKQDSFYETSDRILGCTHFWHQVCTCVGCKYHIYKRWFCHRQVDILVAGFPCVSISPLTTTPGSVMDGSCQSGLGFKSVESYCKKHLPPMVLLENVGSLFHQRTVEGEAISA